MRWVQGRRADFERGTSSAPHVRQDTSFSGTGGGLVKRLPRIEVRWLLVDLAVLTTVSAGAGLSGNESAGVLSSLTSVTGALRAVLRAGGLVVAVVEDLRTAGAGSVLRRSTFGVVVFVVLVLVLRFSFAALTASSCSF